MVEVLSGSAPLPLASRHEPSPSFRSPTTTSHDNNSPATASSTDVTAQRPSLTRKDTSGASGGTPGGGMAANPAGCRLLWRGKVMSEDGLPLHGVAFIAHLFTVSSSFSPSLASSSVSPFDDPFSSSTNSIASGADMCLGLEMLRGAPIAVKGEVKVRWKGESPVAERKLPSSGGKKGKGKAKEEDVQTIEVETPTDVRVYIDERCPETVDWFEDKFCREGSEGCGIRVDAGGEEVILFAAYPDIEANHENVDPTASTSTAPSRPPLTLLLGRQARATLRRPRPDDPAPRENLFAKRLRKTASLPAPVTAEPAPSAKKPRRQSAKDKAIASLLGAKGEPVPPPRKARASSSQPPNIAFPPPAAPASRAFGRSTSYQRLPSVGPTRDLTLGRQSSLPPLAAASARRSSTAGPSTRPFQRTASRSSMLLASPPGSDDEDTLLLDSREGRHASRAPSPTPSVASAFGDLDEEGDFVGEGMDAVAELRSFGAGASKGRSAGAARGLARSSSLPVGQFAMGKTVGAKKAEAKARNEREGTVLPSVREGEETQAGGEAIETRNKNTVKKLTLNRMIALGCGKAHLEFRDVFSFTTRGVAFAMRATFKLAILSPADRERASDLIEQHLRLYLPPSFFASSASTLAPPAPSVKMERVESAGPPSPKSLGDGLEDSLVNTSILDSQDIDMPEPHLHVEDAEAMEDTQVVDEDEEDTDEVVLVSVAGASSAGPAGLAA
ncbi:hypothetical protein NBRC10513_001454 [Rhodotorula toruloides]